MSPVVVKVGGSLYDLAELGPRLKTFLTGFAAPVLVVPGGGAAAEAIRDFDRIHRLGDEASHWLALRACTVNGHFLAGLLGDVAMVADVARAEASGGLACPSPFGPPAGERRGKVREVKGMLYPETIAPPREDSTTSPNGAAVNSQGRKPLIAVVDPFAFAVDDERRADHWPHRWDVTSDSLALRVAKVASASN